MGSINNNTDFQSELLRINGTLQASITELRYHCEVYRLSLKSISKVLDSVHKEQDGRLRYLATSRPNFLTYLLNLSQKQALDRIKNVVRKASTFINGYSLVDKQLFQPPPPKPTAAARRSCDENKNAASTDNTKLTDGSGLGWASKSCSGPGISPVIAKNELESKERDAKAVSSKNNKGKVERKHSRSRRRRLEKKVSRNASKSKGGGSASSSRSKHKCSSSASSVSGDVKRRWKSDASNDDGRNCKEIKRSQSEKEKARSKIRSRATTNCFTLPDSAEFNEEDKGSEWQNTVKHQTRSKSITVDSNLHDNHPYHHQHHQHHRRRHQVINSRTLSNHRDKDMEQDHNESSGGLSNGKPSNSRKQQTPLMSQSDCVANRIPPLLSIATIKSAVSSHVTENLRTETRRVCRPSNERQLEDRRTHSSCLSTRPDNQTETKLGGGGRSQNGITSQSDCAIHLSGIHENKTTTVTKRRPTTTRWSNSNTITAKKAGYKVRESLAVLRNRNGGNAHQGQGVVARKYLFSSHKPSNNNFKLNFTTTTSSSTTYLSSAEKVWRIQLSGNSSSRQNGTFIGSSCLKEEKPYGALRKSASNSKSGNGNCGSNNNGNMRSNSTLS